MCNFVCSLSVAGQLDKPAQPLEGYNSSVGTSAYSDNELEMLFPDYITDENEVVIPTEEEIENSDTEVVTDEIEMFYESNEDDIDGLYDKDIENTIPIVDESKDELIEDNHNKPAIDELVVNPETENVDALSDIEVFGIELKIPNLKIDLRRSSTTISREEIERRQANDIMELVESIAGISIVGGTRTSGKGFSIRGFSDNEDILTLIDGARQNFERYRYGSGVDIEPDLLKEVEVIRGSSVRTAGSGTLGGAVIMKTKNARDFLEPERNWGLELKTGYATNNNNKKGGLTAFAQPLPFADILFNVINTDSRDVTFPDGERLPNSKSKQFSTLGKIGIFTLDFELDLAYRYSDETVREPANIIDNSAALNEDVLRHRTNKSPSINLKWDPGSPLINLTASIAYNNQSVEDTDIDPDTGSINLINGDVDLVEYNILNINLNNKSEIDIGPLKLTLDAGFQSGREIREFTKLDLATGIEDFDEQQPPGKKQSIGGYIDTTVSWSNFTISAGGRYDNYLVTAGGKTAEALERQQRTNGTGFSGFNFGTGITYKPNQGPLLLFYNLNTSFRSPLIDEYYTLGDFSRCKSFSIYEPKPTEPERDDYLVNIIGLIAYLDALDTYENVTFPVWEANPFNANNASCGDAYEDELSNTHEFGMSMDWAQFFKLDAELISKLTYFQIRTDHLIESIYEDSVTGEILQNGEEFRQGFEFEISYDSDTWFGNLSLATLEGNIAYNYFVNNNNIPVDTSDQDQEIDLFNIPGNNLSFSIGYRPKKTMELGYRFRVVGSRRASQGIDDSIPGCENVALFTIPSCLIIGIEPGYSLHNLFASWKPFENIRLGIVMNNITNKAYFGQGAGGGTGQVAPGRDLRLTLKYTFE